MTWKTKKKSVLVPLVRSAECIEALSVAAEFVEEPSDLHVAHVIYPPSAVTPGIVWESFNLEDLEKRAKDTIQNELTQAGFAAAQLHVYTGDPGHVICECADEINAELIVIPSHGRRGFERWMIGSVAEHILRHSSCPVLVLKIPKD